jgi:hypothetical protein
MRVLFLFLTIVGLTWWTTTATLAVDQGLLETNGLLLTSGGPFHGSVEIRGVAQHPTFRKWQIDLQLGGDPTQTTFVAVSETAQPALGLLTVLDTTRYPNGNHILRLRVVHSNLNYDEYFTPITVENTGATAIAEVVDLVAPVTDSSDGPLGQGIPEGEQRIEVDLSDQILTAWQGDVVVLRTIISSGRAEYPTVTGSWPIRTKLVSTRMVGPGYDTPDVPWTMYYYRGYAIHGAYWHNNFGTPVSHGCVNMRPDEAKRLFEWAQEGTMVTVYE